MPFTYRVFGLLESELRKNLAFFFVIDRNLTRPGSRQIRPGDRFEVRAFARNDSSLPLLRVCGQIEKTAYADLPTTDFKIDRLEPHAECEIARFEIAIERAPDYGPIFNQLATLSVSATADLSEFRFTETRRPLPQCHPATDTGKAHELAGDAATAPARSRWAGALPLSPSIELATD